MTASERLVILNLLRDGKISTEEAERLLRAVGPSDDSSAGSGRKEWDFGGFFNRMEREFQAFDFSKWQPKFEEVFDGLRKRFSEVPWDTPQEGETANEIRGEASLDLPNVTGIHIRQKGGAVRLSNAERDHLEVHVPLCHLHIGEDETRAELEAVGGKLHVAVPAHVRRAHIEATGGKVLVAGVELDSLTVRSVGGGAEVRHASGRLHINAVGGGILLNEIRSHDVEAEASGGSVVAHLGDIREGSFKLTSTGGGVTVGLGPESDFEIRYSVSGGVLESQWAATPSGKNCLRVGDGRATIEITSDGGPIVLLKDV